MKSCLMFHKWLQHFIIIFTGERNITHILFKKMKLFSSCLMQKMYKTYVKSRTSSHIIKKCNFSFNLVLELKHICLEAMIARKKSGKYTYLKKLEDQISREFISKLVWASLEGMHEKWIFFFGLSFFRTSVQYSKLITSRHHIW